MKTKLEQVREGAFREYRAKTPGSARLDQEARGYLPGGDTRTTVYFGPYPVYMERGEGCRLFDHDGNQYLDFQNNYTSLIHGHAHPATTEAGRAEMLKGTIYGAPTQIQVTHAARLRGRIPGLERVRYCNSGTEATMMALRAARAFSGRELVVKMDGGYHGSHDQAEVNLIPDLESDGPPRPHVERGVPACTLEGVLISPFNDLEALEGILAAHRDRVAALIVEPVMGAAGLINPEPGYLQGLRELTQRYGVLLILDEIITFRLHPGGVQTREGIVPDLTTLGKIIGGGLPVGAFGGRAEVMAVFDPASPRALGHGGTFNGNGITLAAGLATLEAYDQAACDRLNGLGERCRQGFEKALASQGIKAALSGQGSLLALHWGEGEPVNARGAVLGARAHAPLYQLLHLSLVNRGIHTAARGMYVLSTAMGEGDVDRAVEAFGESLGTLRPVIEEGWPNLLKD